MPIVDGGVRWIQKCATDEVTFRNSTDGWLRNACGDLYRSDDQGRTWHELPANAPPVSLFPRLATDRTFGPIRFVTWLSEDVGLIGGRPPYIARTTDAGKTWTQVRIPTSEGIWHEEHVQSRVWLCDGRGALVRSDDGGGSWRRLSKVGGVFGCFDLSFADRDHGWVSVPMRANVIFETSDGGLSWKQLALPTKDFQNPMVFRVSKDVGWVYESSGKRLFAVRTSDGGKTWATANVTQPLAPKLLLSRIPGVAHEVMAAAPVHDLAGLQQNPPVPPRYQYARVDSHQVIRLEDGLLRYYVDGKLVASTGVLGRTANHKEPLLGTIRTRNGAVWGWSERHVFHSDDGKTWYVVGDAPDPPLETMVLVNDATALARSRSGKLFRSDGWFRTWYETDDPANEDDFTRLAPKAARGKKR